MNSVTASPNRIRRLILLVFIPLGVLLAAAIIYLNGGRYVETDNAYVKAEIIPVSTEVSARVIAVHVDDNQRVEKGQLLLELDPAAFNISLLKAESKLGEVEAELAALLASYEEKKASLELARSQKAYAERELARQKDLKGKNFVSESTLDNLEQAVIIAGQELTVLTLDLKRIEASLGGDAEQPIQLHPRYKTALAELDAAKLNVSRTKITSPQDGYLNKAPRVGQFLAAGSPALVVVSDNRLWIEANYPEKELTHVKNGQSVNIHIDTYPDFQWQGVVESLSPATGSEFSILPAQNATGNWVKVPQRVPVRIAIQNNTEAPTLRVGLSAIVEIDTEYKRSLF